MKIICLNGWGGRLHDKLIPYLKKSHPDILCLQEVVHTPSTDRAWLTYRDKDRVLTQRANFFRDVSKVLPGHVGIFCPAAQGVLWDEDTKVPSQWGLATFVRKSFPIIEQFQGFVHKSFSPYDYGEHPRSRSAHVVKVYDYEKSSPVVVAHMHGLRDLKGKLDTPERATQAHRFISMVNKIAEDKDMIVMCGDFNVVPGSETLKILSQAGLIDLVTSRSIKGTRTSYYKKPNKYADYMLINEHVKVSDFKVVNEPVVSDHCPILLEI